MAIATAMGCPSTDPSPDVAGTTDTDPNTGQASTSGDAPTTGVTPSGTCQQTIAFLEQCGETVPENFEAQCEGNLDVANLCDECETAVTACYADAGECTTVAQIDACVAGALGFEQCFCEDPGDDETTEGEQPPTFCGQSYLDLIECGKSPDLDYIEQCEADLAFGADCHFECEQDLQACYGISQCETLEEVQSCVASVMGFESCLCDDGGGSGTGTTG